MITVYGADGYMKHANAILNKANVRPNPDGTVTARFGSVQACGDLPNRLDVAAGWNDSMRIYRPGPTVLDGTYRLPRAVPAPVRSAGGDRPAAGAPRRTARGAVGA